MGTMASLSLRYIAPPRARRKGHIRLGKLAIYLSQRPDGSSLHHPPFKCFKLLIIGSLFMSLLLDPHIYNPISTGGNKPSIVSQLGSPSRRTGYCQLRHHHPGQVREPLRAGPPVVLPGARRLCG